MNVLSLFDGMSCGRIALERAGIKVDQYYASEIDKHAIAVSKENYPDTIHLGDVSNVKMPQVDLLLGGSPCQGFSFAGKQLNFSDPRSKLFFEFVRILNESNPKYFLLENVNMKKEFQDVISAELGVQPILINSKLVSAQNRVRLYWTNIPGIEEPSDKNIKLQDILEDGRKHLNKATILGRRINGKGHREDYNKCIPIVQCLEVRATNREKSNCLTTVDKDNVLTPLEVGRHLDAYGLRGGERKEFYPYTLAELCRLQTVPVGYFGDIVSESQARKMLGNGWTVDVIAHILKNIK